MYLVHYSPATYEVLGYLDASMGLYPQDDGTAYFSVSDEIHAQYSQSQAWTDGKVITNVAPINKFAELTPDGWIVNEEAQALALNQAKIDAKKAIDDAVADIYHKFTRFAAEYDVREKQAIAYKKANYKGDIPSQISAFAEPAKIDAKKATDIILRQSIKLRTLLDKLGRLRMQKVAVSAMTTIDDVDNHKNKVISKIITMAEQA